MTTELRLEVKDQPDTTQLFGNDVIVAMGTPDIDEEYWLFRVLLTDDPKGQAIVGFPKFGTIGVGFAQEENWNTNLPYNDDTEEIFSHIRRNKGNDAIPDDDVRAAIKLVQDAAGLYLHGPQ